MSWKLPGRGGPLRGPGRADVVSSKAAVKVPVTNVSGGPGGSLCAGPSPCPAPPGPVLERAL